jgi:type VI protein secretion system component VasK
MGQVTIYLDDESEKRLKSAAKAAGVPVSRWVAQIVREKTRTVWPESVRQLAGAWSDDFPELEDIRRNEGDDNTREML